MMGVAAKATSAQLAVLRGLVSDRVGIDVPPERWAELAEILYARAHATGERCLDVYLARTARDPAEIERVASGVTVHETYFFRDRAQLDAVIDHAICDRALQKPGRRIQVLSAGAATGAEAYTIAILLRERRPDLVPRVDILGIDLASAAIHAARRGRYTAWALRDTEPERARRWFHRSGDHYEVHEELREAVSFERGNLLDAVPALVERGGIDVIICRNVIMYFTRAAAQSTVTQLFHALDPGGYLFLGPSEALHGMSAGQFELARHHETSFYRRPTAPPPAIPARRPPRPPPPVRASAPAHTAAAPPLPAPERNGRGALIRQTLALVEHGDLGRAAEACARAHEADDLDPLPHYLKSLCCERAGDMAGAVRHATAAAYLDPTFAMPCLHLARLAKRTGDLRAARRELGRAMTLLAHDDEARLRALGGGLDRRGLLQMCSHELQALGSGR